MHVDISKVFTSVDAKIIYFNDLAFCLKWILGKKHLKSIINRKFWISFPTGDPSEISRLSLIINHCLVG